MPQTVNLELVSLCRDFRPAGIEGSILASDFVQGSHTNSSHVIISDTPRGWYQMVIGLGLQHSEDCVTAYVKLRTCDPERRNFRMLVQATCHTHRRLQRVTHAWVSILMKMTRVTKDVTAVAQYRASQSRFLQQRASARHPSPLHTHTHTDVRYFASACGFRVIYVSGSIPELRALCTFHPLLHTHKLLVTPTL